MAGQLLPRSFKLEALLGQALALLLTMMLDRLVPYGVSLLLQAL